MNGDLPNYPTQYEKSPFDQHGLRADESGHDEIDAQRRPLKLAVRHPRDIQIGRRLGYHRNPEAGKWPHIWRIVGEYANFSIVDVESNDELHQILSALPLFPYMTIHVTPLATHPFDVKAESQ